MWEFYFTAKVLLERGSENYNPKKAVGFLIESARLGNTVAKYRLGKLYLQGKEIGKNLPEALYWLEAAVKEDNQYAEYLLGKTLLQGEERNCSNARQSKGIDTRHILWAKRCWTGTYSHRICPKRSGC